jgi:hypothetical protein
VGELTVLETALALATMLAAPATQDTTVALRPGDRIVIEALSGDVSVVSWDRDVLEVREDDETAALKVERSGSTVRIAHGDERRRRRTVEATIRLPSWIDLQIGGPTLDVSVRGVRGRLEVGNVRGDIQIVDAGWVDVRSIDGKIVVIGATGGVNATSQADDVHLSRVTGPVSVHSGSGDVELEDIRSESVRAETQDGDIDFSGTISDSGDYGFFVHDGDATIAIPSSAHARVSVSTFDGEFESEFPVRLEQFSGGREFEFTVGEGTARLQIQVFDGEIRLVQRR